MRRAAGAVAASLLVLVAGCAGVREPLGCSAEELKSQPVAPGAPDEASCIEFSIDATQEPGTLHAPTVLTAFPFDPANAYRLSVVSTSAPWRDGPAPATPEQGWKGWWWSFVGMPAHYGAVCPRARMYQAVCAPSGAPDHCHAADAKDFHPDEIGDPTCFVNDWAGHYGNNSGCVAVRLCKLRGG